MTEAEIKQHIAEVFEQNYNILKTEAGHGLTEDVKQNALEQVFLYYKKCKEIAERVTDTEVKLTLANQKTNSKKKPKTFAIEGIVDIVSENGKTWMYDLKTDSLDHIESNMRRYEAQLNVYTHIYQELRKQELEGTAIISTAVPMELKAAIESKDQKRIDAEMEKWHPVLPMKDFSQESIQATIEEFKDTVDKIETNQFSPPPVTRLGEKLSDKYYGRTFARRTCGNCDARYSCKSYQEYTGKGSKKRKDFEDRRFYDVYDSEEDKEAAATFNTVISVLGEDIDFKD
jgi:hypothetical protein